MPKIIRREWTRGDEWAGQEIGGLVLPLALPFSFSELSKR